jgi:hypothetical protein
MRREKAALFLSLDRPITKIGHWKAFFSHPPIQKNKK